MNLIYTLFIVSITSPHIASSMKSKFNKEDGRPKKEKNESAALVISQSSGAKLASNQHDATQPRSYIHSKVHLHWTPLMTAAVQGKLTEIERRIKAGDDVGIENIWGKDVYFYANGWKNKSMARYLNPLMLSNYIERKKRINKALIVSQIMPKGHLIIILQYLFGKKKAKEIIE